MYDPISVTRHHARKAAKARAIRKAYKRGKHIKDNQPGIRAVARKYHAARIAATGHKPVKWHPFAAGVTRV